MHVVMSRLILNSKNIRGIVHIQNANDSYKDYHINDRQLAQKCEAIQETLIIYQVIIKLKRL